METIKELFKISVSLRGVKKRCRKSDFHLLNGGYIEYNGGDFDRAAIEAIANGLVESNIKEVNSPIVIHLDHVKQGDYVEMWEPFSDKNVKWQLKTPLEIELS